MNFYKQQTEKAENETLKAFKRDLDALVFDHKWPLEVRVFVISHQIKHSFLYEEFTFLRNMYMWLKQVDYLNTQMLFRDAILIVQ